MMEESFKDKLVAAVSIEPPIKGAQIVERIIQLCMEELVAGDNSLKAALDKEKAQPSPSCGRVFDRAELIYHCNDCAVDETCVLCSGCFQKADHEGHDYHYYVSRGDGGSCDCGELESWKKTLSCSYHQITQTEALRSPSSPVLLDRLESIYSLVLHIIGDYLEQIVTKTVYMTDKPSFSVILFNDERHNFQEVIHEVSMATQKPLAFGENIAREVDQQGMTSVFNFTTLEDKPIAEEIKGRFLRIRLLSMIEPTEFLIGRLICNGLFQFLLHMAKNYPSLREPLYRELCAKNHNFFDGSKSILEFIFVNDDQFWKSARKSWQNLLTAGLQFDFLKQCLLSCFLIHTNSIIAQKASDREPHLSMTHFAVQILTVPSIAMAAAQRDYVMETYNGLRDYGVGMRRGGRVDNVLEVAGDLIQIGRHVLTDSSVTQSRILEKADNYTCAFDIMEAFQGLFPKEILLREHVEFESPLWMEELNLSYMLYALCEDFARGLGQTRDLIETCIFKKIGGYQWADSPKKRSFQQPLLWLVSFFLPLYLKLTDQPCDLDSSITHAALRSINFLAEVKSGLWVRNGATVRGQAMLALSFGIHTSYLAILWHAFARGNMNIVLEYFEPKSLLGTAESTDNSIHVSIQRHFVQDVLLATLLGSDVGRCEKGQLQMAVVHTLSTGPKTYSELKKGIKGLMSRSKWLDEVVASVADLIDSESPMSASKYQLKPESVRHYNPYYWNFEQADRIASHEYMQQKFRINPLLVALNIVNQSEVYFKSSLQNNSLELLKHLLHLSLNGESYSRFMDDFAVFAALCVRSGLKTKINGYDEPCFKILCAYIKKTDPACKEILVNTFSTVFEGFKFSDEESINSTDVKKIDAKAAAEERRRKVMDAMRLKQLAFTNLNPDAVYTTARQTVEEDCSMIESGTCVVCKEIADQHTEEYGILVYYERIALAARYTGKEWQMVGLDPMAISCFHLMHKSCYKRLKNRRDDINCPLCTLPAEELYLCRPITLTPQDGLDFMTVARSQSNVDYYQLMKENGWMFKRRYLHSSEPDPLSVLWGGAEQLCYLRDHSDIQKVERIVSIVRADALLKRKTIKPPKNSGGPLNFAHEGYRVFRRLLYYFFVPTEPLSPKMPLLVAIVRTLLLTDVLLFSYRSKAGDLDLTKEVPSETIIRAFDHIDRSFRIMVNLIHLWFGLKVPQQNFDLTCLFPQLSQFATDKERSAREVLKVCRQDYEQVSFRRFLRFRVVITKFLEFINLPEDYADLVLYNGPDRENCSTCDVGLFSFMCLICGTWICANLRCTFNPSICSNCPSSPLMVLDVPNCAVVLITFIRGMCKKLLIPAPYLTRHGESNMGFKRGGPLNLSHQRYDYLKKLYLTGEIRSFMTRNRAEHLEMMDVLTGGVNVGDDDDEDDDDEDDYEMGDSDYSEEYYHYESDEDYDEIDHDFRDTMDDLLSRHEHLHDLMDVLVTDAEEQEMWTE